MRKLVLWSFCAVSKTLENVSERKLLRKLWIVSQEIKRNFEHSSPVFPDTSLCRPGFVFFWAWSHQPFIKWQLVWTMTTSLCPGCGCSARATVRPADFSGDRPTRPKMKAQSFIPRQQRKRDHFLPKKRWFLLWNFGQFQPFATGNFHGSGTFPKVEQKSSH